MAALRNATAETLGLRRRERVGGDEEVTQRLTSKSASKAGLDAQLLEQARKEAQSTRRFSLCALFMASISVCCASLLFQESEQHPGPDELHEVEGMERIKAGWVWTAEQAIVREGISKKSAEIGMLAAQTRALVKEVVGIRARIIEPLAGWVSTVASNGTQILTAACTDPVLAATAQRVRQAQKIQRDAIKALKQYRKKNTTRRFIQKVLGARKASHQLDEFSRRPLPEEATSSGGVDMLVPGA